MRDTIQNVVAKYNNDRFRLMDILWEAQSQLGHLPDEALKHIAEQLGMSKVDVEQTVTFYHFYSKKPMGRYRIYLNNSAVACMSGRDEIAKEFERNAGTTFGKVTEDGQIGLFDTACIGMNDQEPAALINGKMFTRLSRAMVQEIVADMKAGKSVDEIAARYGSGDGQNAHPLMKSMVYNNLRKRGQVLFSDYQSGTGLKKVVEMQPGQVIAEVKTSNIRGRGGAGFPAGMKWDFCSRETDPEKYVVCNADEGEPGTFKDRVLLTETPRVLFEGMAIAGYAIGAQNGILYLRSEYWYMNEYLQKVIADMKQENLLGNNILGKSGFNFDIRIQMGAGAYVCGEESALIESAEGKRGEPRNRPPFPVQKGYMQKPTVVNNVETLCAVSRILEKGGAWFKAIGTPDSSGTKALSISGDCRYPGVYEIEWGMTIKEMLEMVGADLHDVQAVQVSGPSGVLVPPSQYHKKIAYEDLQTGGSMIVIGKQRDILKDIVLNFTEFFVEESCGSCVPCRAFGSILKEKLEKIMHGNAIAKDIEELEHWGNVMKVTNRCGLGQTAAAPILTAIEHFKPLYESKVQSGDYISEFNMEAAVADSCAAAGRVPNH